MDQFIDGRASDNLRKRSLLEAERLHFDARLRDFSGVKWRVIAAKGDPQEMRDLMLKRRDWIVERLHDLAGENSDAGDAAPESDGSRPGPELEPSAPLNTLPISAQRFRAGIEDALAFGYSGLVQMPRATEHDSMNPGRDGTSGEFVTTRRRVLGGVEFEGHLESNVPWAPDGHWPDEPILNLWYRSWSYLIPLPPPPVESVLTYRFNVAVRVAVVREHGEAEFMSAVALGHVPSFTLGTNINVNMFAGWPLNADLGMPIPPGYNGSYGTIAGTIGVQRSLTVGAGASPAVAVVLSAFGIIGDLVNHEAVCDFRFGSTDSMIRPEGDNGLEGRVAFHYQPVQVFAPE